MVARVLFLLISLCLVVPAGFAQSGTSPQAETPVEALPLVRLNTLELTQPEPLTITATALTPEAPYTLILNSPEGEERTETLQADAAGELVYETQLDAPGTWQITLEGEDLDATFEVIVEAAPAPTFPPGTQPTEVVLEDGAVVARVDADTLWRFDFPENSGETEGLLEQEGTLYVGHGNSVLVLSRETGEVQNRWLVSGQVEGLSAAEGDVIVTTRLQEGLGESLTLRGGELQEPVRFDTDPELFTWLRQEAQVDDPAARLERDPTNPWLYLAAGQAATGAQARSLYTNAVATAQTFYDLAGLSQVLVEEGETDLANRAMDAALTDFAERGYDPRLLRDTDLHAAYNFPLVPFEAALDEDNLARAGFWAAWLSYFATPEVPEVRAALRKYANDLRRTGQRDMAAQWREVAQGERVGLSETLESWALLLGRAGWLNVLALLVAILALHLVLVAKYWRAQSINLERRRILGKPVSPVSRLLVMRYYSTLEKLVLVLLFALTLLLASVASWYERGGDAEPGLGAGTLASAEAQSFLAAAPLQGERGEFVRGYAAQTMGDTEQAQAAYEAAGEYAPALNNLGVLSGDRALFEEAVNLSSLAAARFNVGGEVPENRFAFQLEYLPDQSVLAVPQARDLKLALSGTWDSTLAQVFRAPWLGLQEIRPVGFNPYLWLLVVVLFFLAALVTLVWLFIPRMRWVHDAPRPFMYQLLALLVPGSGLADEMWGLLLLIPWALVGLDVLAEYFNWGATGLGLSLRWELIILVVIYVINLIAVAVEFLSYRRRMIALERDNPELAEEYGLRSVRAR